MDDLNREALRIEIDTGLPAKLWLDNGPELIGEDLAKWADKHGVHLLFIQPGRPMQNGFIERFNRTYREEMLKC